jgi:hypothetical protein
MIKCNQMFTVYRVPKKMYTNKVNIPYYNVYTSFWDTCISISLQKVFAADPHRGSKGPLKRW